MKIDDKIISYELTGNTRNQALGGADRVGREKLAAGEKVPEQDPPEEDAIVRLSEASREVRRIKEIVLSQPEVREEKVADLREKIESGEYAVDYESVADRMVNAFIDDLI